MPRRLRLDLVEVEAETLDDDAEGLELALRLVEGVRGLHHRLGRDAADVEAGAADGTLLHADHARAELGGPDRCRVAAGAGAEDEKITFHGGTYPPTRAFSEQCSTISSR